MNKKNLSIVSLFALSVALLGGCNKGDKNVSEIVLQVGNEKYTADQLYNHLLSTGTGANEAFAMVLRLVIESSMDTNVNMRTAADLAEEKFEEEVETYATTNGVRVKEARKAVLKEKGYSSVAELRADVIYEQKLTRVSEKYWEDNKESFYAEYIKNRLPYLVSHVLVKLDDNTNGNKIANNVNVSQSEAEKLYDVITRFKEGDTFAYVANHFSDDSGSVAKGGSYYMDTTTSFVDEFLYGTYIFDAYTEKKTEGAGESATTYFQWGRNGKYELLEELGFINDSVYEAPEGETTPVDQVDQYYKNGLNLVEMDVVEKLGEVANKTSTGDFHYIGYVKDQDYISGEVTEYDSSINNLNSNYNAYARSIIFNRAFNKPGLSVIGYKSKTDVPAEYADQFVEIRDPKKGTSMWVLASGEGENKSPIFFVAAKGSSNDVWVHFLNINVSSLQSVYDVKNHIATENVAQKYFDIDPDATGGYSEDPKFNVDGTKASKKKLIAEIESYVKSYVTVGAGGTVGEESLLNFRMLEDYMKGDIDWKNDNLEMAIASYITRRREYLNTVHKNNLLTTFNKHVDKLTTSEDALVKMGIKPYECAVLLDSDAYAPINSSTSTGNLCRYVYGHGYQVRLSYFYHTNLKPSSTSYTRITAKQNDVIWFNENNDYASKYLQWIDVGTADSVYNLPTVRNGGLNVKSGYVFKGWYTTSDFKDGTRIDDPEATDLTKDALVDFSTSTINHHTIFYARVETQLTDAGEYTVDYKYKYVGSDLEVDESLIANGDNPLKIGFTVGGENKGVIDPTKFSSDKLRVVGISLKDDGKYDDENIEITVDGSNPEEPITVVVYVELKSPVTLKYEYVFENGEPAGVDPDNTNELTQPFFNTENGEVNKISVDREKIAFNGDYVITDIKIARSGSEFASATSESEFKLQQSDTGTIVTIYVVVEATTATE